MNDIVCRDQEAHLRIDGNNKRLVNFEQVVLTLIIGVVNFLLRRRKIREERYVFAVCIQVFVTPLPLIAGNENAHFSIIVVVDFKQCGGRWNGHSDQD